MLVRCVLNLVLNTRRTDKEEEDSKKEDNGNAEDNGKRKEEKGPRQRRPRGIHTNKVTEIEQLKVSGGSQQPLGAKRSRIKPPDSIGPAKPTLKTRPP